MRAEVVTVFVILPLIFDGGLAQDEETQKKIRIFNEGFDKFVKHQGAAGDPSTTAKNERFKVFEKNFNAMKISGSQGANFKQDTNSVFLYMSEDERSAYLGLRNATEMEQVLETDLPKLQGQRPFVPPGISKVKERADKLRPGRSKGQKKRNSRGKKPWKKANENAERNGKEDEENDKVLLEKRQEETALLTSLDLRNLNLVSPPRDQLSCGSCWAFGATAALEGAFALATGIFKEFSDQQMINCNLYYGCDGGFWGKGWKQVQEDRYVALKEDEPYTGSKRSCDKTSPNGLTDIMALGSFSVHRVEDDENTMLGFLSTYGPIVVGIKANNTLFYYGSGVINYCMGGRSNIDHLVTLVGYDETSLLMKNSWGTDWGEDGFFRVARGCGPSLLGYSYWASYVSVVSLVEGFSTPFEESTVVYGSDYIKLRQAKKVQYFRKDISDIGLKIGDVITMHILDEALPETNFRLELLHQDAQKNVESVYRLQHFDRKVDRVKQMTKASDGSILKSIKTKTTLSQGAVIDIMIGASGYSVSFDGVDLPIHPHVLPLETVNKILMVAPTPTGLFLNATLTRQEETLLDLSGETILECVDLDSYCANYLEEDANACTNEATAEWMKSYCPKSCNSCP